MTSMIDLLKETNKKTQAFEELDVLLAERNICIAVKERLAKDSGVAGEESYNDIVKKLASKSNATGKLRYIKHVYFLFLIR